MFTCGQPWRAERTYHALMTVLQMVIPVVESADTREAQDGRWIAWVSRGAAADRVTARRVRIAFTAILIAVACVTLAVVR